MTRKLLLSLVLLATGCIDLAPPDTALVEPVPRAQRPNFQHVQKGTLLHFSVGEHVVAHESLFAFKDTLDSPDASAMLKRFRQGLPLTQTQSRQQLSLQNEGDGFVLETRNLSMVTVLYFASQEQAFLWPIPLSAKGPLQTWPPDKQRDAKGLVALRYEDHEVRRFELTDARSGRAVELSPMSCESVGWHGGRCIGASSSSLVAGVYIWQENGEYIASFEVNESPTRKAILIGTDHCPTLNNTGKTILKAHGDVLIDRSASACLVVSDAFAELRFESDQALRVFWKHSEDTQHAVGSSIRMKLPLAPWQTRVLSQLKIIGANGVLLETQIPLRMPQGMPGVTIDSVLPNPAGNDSLGEYVQLRNFSDQAIDLGGLEIRDDLSEAGIALPSFVLSKGQSLRLVGPRHSGSPIMATLVLPSLNLRNDGESLWLVDPYQRVISGSPPLEVDEDQCIRRVGLPRDHSPNAFVVGECTPWQ